MVIVSQKCCRLFMKFACVKAHIGSMRVVKTMFFEVTLKVSACFTINIFCYLQQKMLTSSTFFVTFNKKCWHYQHFLLTSTKNVDINIFCYPQHKIVIVSQKCCRLLMKFACVKAHTGSMRVVKTVFFKVAFTVNGCVTINIFCYLQQKMLTSSTFFVTFNKKCWHHQHFLLPST